MLFEYNHPTIVESYLNSWRRVWHPIGVASMITADEHEKLRPIERQVVGESLALIRVDDSFFALNNHCRHRGAKLSQGWFNGQERTFVCPYHGFEWGLNGKLAKIPAYDVSGLACPNSKKWQTKSYQVIERYGILWICLIDEPLLPLPEIPPLKDPSLSGGVFVETSFHTGGGRVVEGTLDTYHIAFAHRDTIGNPHEPEAPQAKVEEGQFLYMEFELEQNQNPSAQGSNDLQKRVPVLYQQWASPNVVFLLKTSPGIRYGLLFLYRVVSPNETVVYRRIFRDANASNSEDECIALENNIDREDKLIVEQILPRIIPTDPSFEVHTVFDKPTFSYRQYMKSLGFEYF